MADERAVRQRGLACAIRRDRLACGLTRNRPPPEAIRETVRHCRGARPKRPD